jgi:cyclophilin family peptidyl-prolyl cis-trans isomerase
MQQLQAAQKRRRRNRRTIPVVVVVVAVVVVLILVTGLSSGNSKKVSTSSTSSTSSSSSTTAGSSTTSSGPTTSLPAGTGPGLVAYPAPAVSASCNTPASGPPSGTAKPASGQAVSIVPAPAHVPFPKLDGSSPRYTAFSAAPPFCIDVTKTYTATVQTDVGSFVIKLLPKDAPVTVNNFVFLSGYHFYDGIVFHRVIPNFMDQVGDPTASGGSGPGYQFKDELPSSNAAYVTGSVAMANSGPNTNGSQFFVVVPGGGGGLSPSYSVFGQVTSGINFVQQINSDGTQAGTPSKYHKILSVKITES